MQAALLGALFHVPGGFRNEVRIFRSGYRNRSRPAKPVIHIPQDKAEKAFSFLLSLLRHKVFHIRRQTRNIAEVQIRADILDKPMSGCVVKMLRRTDLGRESAG